MKERKLIKLVMAYDDGEVHSLKGKDAQEWMEWVNGQCVMAQIHGAGGRTFPWTIKKTKKKSR